MSVDMPLGTHRRGVFSQAQRFICVGATATIVHFLTLAFLVEVARLPWPTVASAVGAVCGIATSYCGNFAWTFARSEPHRAFVARFVVAYVFTMSLHTLLMCLQIDYLQLYYIPAFLVATGVSTIINFLLSKFAVFERSGFAPQTRPRDAGYG